MFGYININQKELSEESKKIYQAYYCGLCQKLKTNCGTKGQMLLSYDLTFLIVLLTGLYELENTETEFTCPLHPTKKRTAYINEATEYAADMNLILAYQNLLDDWKDEKSYTKKAFVKILDKDYTRIVSKYPRQVRALEEFMRKTAEAEKNKETNLDLVAGLTGEMLGEIMCWREDEWQEEMRTLGFYMGKFIYLMDAYEDYEADQKKNCYNPLVYMEKENDQEFDTFCKLLLTSMMSECAKSFERLPILLHADILRNILYSGVWSRYEYLQLRKKKLEEKKPVIYAGDLNVAHQEIDLKNAKTNRGNAGFTDEERACFSKVLENGFIDTFRYFYPDLTGVYSWWSYMFQARAKNAGWRIDYFVVSECLKDRLADAKIHTEILGSDHCPIELDLK